MCFLLFSIAYVLISDFCTCIPDKYLCVCDLFQSFNGQCPSHIETSQSIWYANQLTGFYVRETLTVKGLNRPIWLYFFRWSYVFACFLIFPYKWSGWHIRSTENSCHLEWQRTLLISVIMKI